MRLVYISFERGDFLQGEIIVLDAGSQPGASKIQTADDCCNACRQNSQVSMCFKVCMLWHWHASHASQP